MIGTFIWLMEREWLPDSLVRWGVRKLCRERLRELEQSEARGSATAEEYARGLAMGPLAEHSKDANRQHYEVPAAFYRAVLGRHRKYSCAYFADGVSNLDLAEEAALDITVERAGIKDGMDILELGCGWGSLTLFMAARFPRSRVVAVSNSNSQRESILERAQALGFKNLEVRTMDLSSRENLGELPAGKFDRIVSVEMFEHFKNYDLLLEWCAAWLKPDGKLFVHIFTHRRFSYPFTTDGDDNWMGKYFFTGGQMPAQDLLPRFQRHLALETQWQWSGTHYQKTAEAWLKNLDQKRDEVLKIFKTVYGRDSRVWLSRWRVFFISCSELFGFDGGTEWGVNHYLFSRKNAAR